jgi:hypothetical protein
MNRVAQFQHNDTVAAKLIGFAVMNICWRFLVKEDIFAHPWPRPGHPINFNGSFPEQQT